MKYKILTEFLPGVIPGQECEVSELGSIYINFDKKYGFAISLPYKYIIQHPSIFQPIEELKEREPIDVGKDAECLECNKRFCTCEWRFKLKELKENETELVRTSERVSQYWEKCSKCENIQAAFGIFCSNCGRKRVDK